MSLGVMLLAMLISITAYPPSAGAIEIVIIKIVINKNKKDDARAFVKNLEVELDKSARTKRLSEKQLAALAQERAAKFNVEHGVKLSRQATTNSEINILLPGENVSRADRNFLNDLSRKLAKQIDSGKLKEKDLSGEIRKAMEKYAAEQEGGAASWRNEANVTIMISIKVNF